MKRRQREGNMEILMIDELKANSNGIINQDMTEK